MKRSYLLVTYSNLKIKDAEVLMEETPNREALKELRETFGDRLKSEGQGSDGAVASVMPMNVEEMQIVSEVATRYSIPLVPLGAGTTPDSTEDTGGLLIRFDLMRRLRIPEGDESWVETEPGTVWLEVEDELRARGRGLTVYPTSAPRATVGGWVATDGLGVGSFEYGWLSENVLAATVVLPGGELREVSGEDLQTYAGPGGSNATIVDARLRTRVADNDVPFALSFANSQDLLGAVEQVTEEETPFWHLAFLNPTMARSRGIGEDYLLFGAYPRERSEPAEESIHRMSKNYEGKVLPAAETHRVWTERFFPVAPAHPTPNSERKLVEVSQLPELLSGDPTNKEQALQCTISRSKEALLLTLESI